MDRFATCAFLASGFVLGAAFFAGCVGDSPAPAQDGGVGDAANEGSQSNDGGTGACTPGQYRCSGNQLEQCDPNGAKFVGVKVCDTAELCQVHVGAICGSPTCADGEKRCADGGTLQVCNPGRTGFDNLKDCKSNALCTTTDAGCLPPVCQPGEKHCDFGCTVIPKATNDCIKKCNSSLTGWELDTDCGYAQPNDRCSEPTNGAPVCI